jgi:hypothetical protein
MPTVCWKTYPPSIANMLSIKNSSMLMSVSEKFLVESACFFVFDCLFVCVFFFFVLLQNKTYPFLAQVCLLFKILILNILSERKSQELVFRPFKWNKKSLYRILCLYLKCFVVLSDKWWRLFFLVYRYINQTGSCLLKMALTLFKYIFVLISFIICLGEFSWSKFWAYKHHVLHQ